MFPMNYHFNKNLIRVVLINKNPYFVVNDIAKVLELKNIRKSISDLKQRLEKADISTKGVTESYTLETDGGMQKVSVISEAGLYELIFGSIKKEAISFRYWISSDVLPSIRKTGSYSLSEKPQKRTDLISVSDSELDRELKSLKFILDNFNFSESEKIAFVNQTLRKINFQTLENTVLKKREPVFTLTKLLEKFETSISAKDFNLKLESFGIIERTENGWNLLEVRFGENRKYQDRTNPRYYDSTFQEILDLVL